uniref:Uncharacterized protein n=1 Tax=viral metagenome TaxID=1070528 RepID=A0A6H1ZIU6_9ZZZZ
MTMQGIEPYAIILYPTVVGFLIFLLKKWGGGLEKKINMKTDKELCAQIHQTVGVELGAIRGSVDLLRSDFNRSLDIQEEFRKEFRGDIKELLRRSDKS